MVFREEFHDLPLFENCEGAPHDHERKHCVRQMHDGQQEAEGAQGQQAVLLFLYPALLLRPSPVVAPAAEVMMVEYHGLTWFLHQEAAEAATPQPGSQLSYPIQAAYFQFRPV